ncbi:hypothetical protein F383_26875 [Gossypium arboreum]
MCLPV